MNRPFLVLLISIFLSAACTKINSPAANSATVSGNNSTAASSTPETKKSDDGFAQSEDGTAKGRPANGKANVQGKVLFNEKPAEGIEVKLCEKFSQFISGCGGEIFKTKTDANGEYLFADVTPRIYEALTVKVFDTKGYVFATQGLGISASKYNLEPDTTFFVSDTNLFKDDLKVQNPKNNSKVDANSLEIKWDAYPDAASYKISINSDAIGGDYVNESTDATNFKVEKPLANGKYRLKVEAYNANKVKISDSGYDYIEFTAMGGAASGASENTNTK